MFKLLLTIPSLIYTLSSWKDYPIFPVHIEENETEYHLYTDSLGSATIQVVEYEDSSLVVETVCAPICSSTARVFDNNNNLLRTIKPTCGGTLPHAWIENGELHWEDNTKQLLDEQELHQ